MKSISACLSGRKNNFDFIRFLAASAVVFSHAYAVVQGENDREPFYIFTDRQSSFGGLAVAVFFIISGFLITRSFLGSKSISDYLLSRSLRILPALVCMVFCTVFLLGPAMSFYSFPDYFSQKAAYAYLWNSIAYTNYSELPGVFVDLPFHHVVNGSLWSLPYEVLFYILLPVFFLLAARKPTPALAFLFVALLMMGTDYLGNDHLLETGNYFLCGSLYYIFREKIPLHFIFALAALALMYVCNQFRYFNETFGILGGYVVLYLALGVKFGVSRFARFGDFSYGIYIWAFPVQQTVFTFAQNGTPLENFLMSFPFILVLGIASWHLVEKRALSVKGRARIRSQEGNKD